MGFGAGSKRVARYILLVIILASIPSFLKDDYLLHVMIVTFLFSYLAECWNWVGGYAGQLSLGHAAFFGIGAYASTLLFLGSGLTPWIGILIGGSLAAAFAALIGGLSLRLRGPFFVLFTIATAETLRYSFLTFREITKGAYGLLIPTLRNDPLLFKFLSKEPYYYIVFTMLLISIAVTGIIERSKIGYFLNAIREDQDAAQSIGIDVTKYKVLALMISAFFTALAGTFYAQYFSYICPDDVMTVALSIEIITIAIIGGAGTLWGPVIGGFVLVPISEYLRITLGGTFAGAHLFIYGAVIIIVIIFAPRGLLGILSDFGRVIMRRSV